MKTCVYIASPFITPAIMLYQHQQQSFPNPDPPPKPGHHYPSLALDKPKLLSSADAVFLPSSNASGMLSYSHGFKPLATLPLYQLPYNFAAMNNAVPAQQAAKPKDNSANQAADFIDFDFVPVETRPSSARSDRSLSPEAGPSHTAPQQGHPQTQ